MVSAAVAERPPASFVFRNAHPSVARLTLISREPGIAPRSGLLSGATRPDVPLALAAAAVAETTWPTGESWPDTCR